MNESSLYDLLRYQDRTAFTYLYDSYSPAVFGEIIRIVKNREAAEDLLQEVFIAIWQKGNQYDPGKGRLFTWMISIARNRCIDHLRKAENNSHNFISGKPVVTDELQGENAGLELSILFKNHSGLSQRHIELIRLVYLYGYTHSEASVKCGIPLGTVKTILRKFIAQTRKKCLG